MIPTSACFKSSAPQPESGGREGGKCFLQLGFLVWDNYVCRFLDYLITYYEHKNHCKVWIWIWIGSGWSSELSTGYTHGQSHFSGKAKSCSECCWRKEDCWSDVPIRANAGVGGGRAGASSLTFTGSGSCCPPWLRGRQEGSANDFRVGPHDLWRASSGIKIL